MAIKRGRPVGSRKYPSEKFGDRYQALEAQGHGVSAILATLEGEMPDATRRIKEPFRTIQRWVREDRRADRSRPWRMSMTRPDDVPTVFASIQAVIGASHGRTRWVTAAEARWIVRVAKLGARVGMTPLEVFGAARGLARSDARDPNDHLEDLKLGIATELLAPDGVFGTGEAGDLREWIDRGPRADLTA